MHLEDLNDIISQHPALDAIRHTIIKRNNTHLLLSGLHASSRAFILSNHLSKGGVWVIVMDNADDAQYMYADLLNINANTPARAVMLFPKSQRRRQGLDEALAIQRTETLNNLAMKREGNEGEVIVVTYPDALKEEVPAPTTLASNTLHLQVGETRQVSTLCEELLQLGFDRMDFVYQPGQFAIRGSIVDIYSYSHDDPYRLDFFGDEIDSIREFDIETQLSKGLTQEACIVGHAAQEEDNAKHSLLSYLPTDTVWISNDWAMVHHTLSGTIADELLLQMDSATTIEWNEKSYYNTHAHIRFNTLPQPIFRKQFDLLEDDLKSRIAAGYNLYILADQKKQTDRLQAIFDSSNEENPIRFTAIDKTIHSGFVDHDLHICCYTDHEIFERFHRVNMRSENARRGKAIMTLKEINQLQIGDYVVHSDHGIATFAGLVSTLVNGKPQEMIKLVFRGGDTVFVSIHNLHRISKYKGKDNAEPTISRLGSGAWERLKERTKDKVKSIARDLIKLYAKRKQEKGFAYTPDGYMQHALEASFLYEDTPDQAKTTADVKHDMESPVPMDRLICGDVGFGKTEIAIRAAFKAATDGKQVAVLVPTTVLALQHYNTFKDRMASFPVRIEYLSRGKTTKETKELIAELEKGKIDILIGTHKIVGKNIKWHDLGLLIIDEEQKFGVAVKDKLKSLRTNVDVLTLTATPIPRTLQFSLLGARDLSVMTTPPQNRYPVQTEWITLDDEDVIKEAIEFEMNRNGQIFVVNNRIEMLERIEHQIHKLCPTARIVVAHGQMPTGEMEERLENFINYDYDILLSTTIIESGVDIPNVNTIIIYSAHKYGLSDLHQLRGRVGRSNRKSYCYLVAPQRELLTADARRRMDAISTFAELGSGFHIAMQDLDIRGAGNLLGAEQSGFIADLGYETYQRILNEAVNELKEEFVKEDEDNTDTANKIVSHVPNGVWCYDTQLESDLPICFPTDYIENVSERISLYRELDSLKDEDQLLSYRKRLIDRFGTLPDIAEELLNVVRLRWLCGRLGIEKIFLKSGRMVIYFVLTNPRYWQSDAFGNIINYARSRAQRCQIVEERDKTGKPTGRRYATIQQVQSVGGAIHLLRKIESGEIV